MIVALILLPIAFSSLVAGVTLTMGYSLWLAAGLYLGSSIALAVVVAVAVLCLTHLRTNPIRDSEDAAELTMPAGS